MKNILILAILLLGATTGFAGTGPSGVGYTPHNLGALQGDITLSQTYSASNTDEVCVFCHTPHGGSLDAPLWNRDLSSLQGLGKFQHYESATLSSTVEANNRAVNAESLTCLSCHDGSIGVGDSLLNNPMTGVPNNSVVSVVSGSVPGPKIGTSLDRFANSDSTTGDLRDDHPVSFSYTAAFSDPTNAGDLHVYTDVEAAGLTLFGAEQNLECSTCHDPHVNYTDPANAEYTPFLAIPNTGSAMCLACHIK